MKEFEQFRILVERIVRERAFEPEQLEKLLSVSFNVVSTKSPDHMHYQAHPASEDLFKMCDLRSPKTSEVQTAHIVFDVSNRMEASAMNIHRAYGESVVFDPVPGEPDKGDMDYLSICLDRADVRFGFGHATPALNSIVIEFRL